MGILGHVVGEVETRSGGDVEGSEKSQNIKGTSLSWLEMNHLMFVGRYHIQWRNEEDRIFSYKTESTLPVHLPFSS